MKTEKQLNKKWRELKKRISIMIEQAELFVEDNPSENKRIEYLKSLILPERKEIFKNLNRNI